MLFEEVVKKRQAVRSYIEKPVEDNLIQKVLELANLSPSAGNLQARKVIIVKDLTVRRKLKASCSGLQKFPKEPPVIFVVCAVPQESAVRFESRGRNLYALQDATIFAAYLQLAAISFGLSTCWVGSFNEKIVSEIVGLPGDLIPVALIPAGYSDEEVKPKDRKTLEEIVFKKVQGVLHS